MPETLQEEMLRKLNPFIMHGRILVDPTDEYWFHLIRSRFPVRSSGICWELVPDVETNLEVLPEFPPEGIDGTEPLKTRGSIVHAFLKQFAFQAKLGDNDKCIVFGDGVTNVAMEMSFGTLLNVFIELFSYPQTTYVIRPDAEWCFAFTFECDMHFGKAPDSLAI